MKKYILTFLLFVIISYLYAQQIENPNFALASHPMKVLKISMSANATIIELSIENQSETGTFCADKNIFIEDIINKKKYQLTESQGIPVCPSNYTFNYIGEVLKFKLYFPALSPDTKFINLIENCDQYCFSINGIILKNDMNKEINLGYDYYAKGKLDFALEAFRMTIKNNPDYSFAIHYFNVIQILAEKNNIKEAKVCYQKIMNSQFPDRNEVINRLKQLAYYSKLIDQ